MPRERPQKKAKGQKKKKEEEEYLIAFWLSKDL